MGTTRAGLVVAVVSTLAGITGCGPDEGAILTFSAPAGPPGAARIEIVLASANTETIGTGIRQRMQPGALSEEDVVYYRQRAKGGVIDYVTTLDGFSVRIEPEIEAAPDEQFIPFALIFDASGALAGVGAVEDPAGNPMPVEIREGVRIEYRMTVTPITAPAADAALAPDQGVIVGCGATAWTSGVAWRPAQGPQLRLLLADLGADPAATDATTRAADLDCDDFAATDDDCDDLRGAFHPGQAETCDGLDTDCDGRRMEVQACALPDGVCGGTGVALCADTGPSAPVTQCQPDPTCACLGNATGCARCLVDTRLGTGGGPNRAACAPAIGKLHLDAVCEGGCTVEVVAVDGPFEVTLAATETGPFASRVQTSALVYLRAKTGGGGFPVPTMTLTSVGRVFLAVTTTQRTQAVNLDLEISDEPVAQCAPAALADHFAMLCTP